ncbi:MAG: LPS export ABC transporter periplasmic protein LptC [Chitinophagaceae bacterium]
MSLAFYRSVNNAAVLCFCLLLYSCENKMSDIKQLSDHRTSVEQGINIDSYFSQAGKMKARLTAPLMKRFQTDSPYVEFPKHLHVQFYNDSTVVESQLFANYGKYRENERKVFLKDSVRVFNNKGDTMYCRELWWDQQKEKFYSDKPVRIHRPGGIVDYGDGGIEASQNFDAWTLFSARGPFKMPADAGLQ